MKMIGIISLGVLTTMTMATATMMVAYTPFTNKKELEELKIKFNHFKNGIYKTINGINKNNEKGINNNIKTNVIIINKIKVFEKDLATITKDLEASIKSHALLARDIENLKLRYLLLAPKQTIQLESRKDPFMVIWSTAGGLGLLGGVGFLVGTPVGRNLLKKIPAIVKILLSTNEEKKKNKKRNNKKGGK